MNLNEAWSRVALSGRELGSGPAQVLSRPEFDTEPGLREIGVAPDKAGGIALGIVVGRVMAEDQAALDELVKINKEWLDWRTGRAR